MKNSNDMTTASNISLTFNAAKLDVANAWGNPMNETSRISRQWINSCDPETHTFVKALLRNLNGTFSLYTAFVAVLKFDSLESLLIKHGQQ